MKRTLIALLLTISLLCLSVVGQMQVGGGLKITTTPAAGASWIKGFNFRATSGYVTDGADETYDLGSTYPITRNGVTFGWDSAVASLDRDSALDRRLAGILYAPNTPAQETFRVDLPATGSYTIRIALGDGGAAQSYHYLQVKDNTTVLFTITDTNGTSSAAFDDATGVERTAAAWAADNISVTHSFSTTTFFMVIGAPDAQAGSTTIAHLQISQN